MTNPTPHGQVPEALIDLIDAYAETRHRCGGIYNAKTEAARKAVIEALSGVQALSAAPAIGDELRDTLVAVSAAIAERDDRAAQKMICEILAASTTPPAEQQAQPGAVYAELHEPDATTVGLGAVWNRHSMRDFADRTYALRMQAAPKAAPGEQNTVPAEWLEQAYREGWAACRDAETIGEEAEDWAFGNSTANSRMIDAQQAAPKQEVQEPHGWLYEWTHSSATGKPDSTYTAFTTDEAHARKHDNCRAIYTAPQPAPATQQAGDVVAYLDVGASGYLDLGAALSEDALQQLPKGRHALVIAGTYGIDGYVAAPQPSPTTKPAPQQEVQEPGEIPESIERMATGRYKVVPSHESMFHRWAVVAGSGTQQLYLGREVECQNMARKFAGAFLDGAFFAMQQPAPQQEAQEPVAWQSRTRPTWGGNTRPWSPWEPCTKEQAEDCWKTPLLHDWAYEARALFTAPQPAPAPVSEREAFEAWIEKDGGDLGTFGTPPNMHYRNSAVNNAWVAWKARAAIAAQRGNK